MVVSRAFDSDPPLTCSLVLHPADQSLMFWPWSGLALHLQRQTLLQMTDAGVAALSQASLADVFEVYWRRTDYAHWGLVHTTA